MGGCETHSADLRTHPASPTHPRSRQPTTRRLFPAPNHRPPLARVKLVRPRGSAPEAPPLRALQLDTRPRGGAKYGQLRGKPAESRTCEPGHHSRVTGPVHHTLLTKGSPMGGRSAPDPTHARNSRRSRQIRRSGCMAAQAQRHFSLSAWLRVLTCPDPPDRRLVPGAAACRRVREAAGAGSRTACQPALGLDRGATPCLLGLAQPGRPPGPGMATTVFLCPCRFLISFRLRSTASARRTVARASAYSLASSSSVGRAEPSG